MHADDPAALDGLVDVGDVLAEPEHGALGHRLEVPAQGDAVDEVGVLEQHRRLDAQDGAGHRRRLAGGGGEDHLPALAEVDGDVGVEGQPPVGQAGRGRDGVPHRLHGIGQVPLEADDPAIGGALQRAVGGRRVSVMRGPSSSGSDRFGGGPEVSLQRVEPVGPLEAVGLQPSVELHQRLRSQAVEAALGVAPHLDEAGVAQHLEVARHPGLVHPHLVDQLADGPLAASHRIEDATTGRLRDHVEDGKAAGHGAEHTHPIYMCKQTHRLCARGGRGARTPRNRGHDTGFSDRCLSVLPGRADRRVRG